MPSDIVLSRHSLLIGAFLGQRVVRSRDVSFDRKVALAGDELTLAAVLDGEVRARALELVNHRNVLIHRGCATWRSGNLSLDEHRALLAQVVELMDCLAERNRTPVRRALQEIVQRDPEQEVRGRAIDLLLYHFGDSREAREACRDAIRFDRSPYVRLKAARGLDEEGSRSLALILFDQDAHVSVRRSALRQLRERKQLDLVGLHGLLSLSEPVTEDALGNRTFAFSGEQRLLREVIWALSVLATRGSNLPKVEQRLCELLHHPEAPVRREAVLALGLCGSTKSVSALEACIRWNDGADMKTVVRAAITQIQNRGPDPSAGGLSLSEETQGQGSVSLASDGEVSFVPGSNPRD